MDRKTRPLSPHVSIYKWPLNAMLSIMHRATGAGMAAGGALVVWWFLAASVSDSYFALVDGLMTSLVGDLVMMGLLAALCYHFCNGIRHLVWDTGSSLDNRSVSASSTIVLTGAALLFVITLIIV